MSENGLSDGWTEVGYMEEDGVDVVGRPPRASFSSGLRITLEVDGEEVDPTTPFYWSPELGRVEIREADRGE